MSKESAQYVTQAAEFASQIDYDRPAKGQIYGIIREAIVSMQLQPGQLISETVLAGQFGVSRTPVREALIKLSNQGFVEVRPQRGTYVTKLSMENILEARFIREALEVSVVSFLAENTNSQLFTDAQQIIAEQEKAAAANDALLFRELDDKFHQLLANNAGYQRLARMIEEEKAHIDRVRTLSLHVSGQYERVLTQHRAIVEALKSGQADKAAQAMTTHLREIYKTLETLPAEHPEYFG